MNRIMLTLAALSLSGTALQAGTAQLASKGAATLDVWTDNLVSDHRSLADPSAFGFGLGIGNAMRFETKAALQQNTGAFSSDGGYVAWTGRLAPQAFGLPHLQFELESVGTLDAVTGDYRQSVSGALRWQAGAKSLLPSLALMPEFAREGSDTSLALGIGAEWVLRSRELDRHLQTHVEVKAHLRYRSATDASSSMVAGVELHFH